MSWTREDTERWLNDYPLPANMEFHGERVWPRYNLKRGYGFWLRTAGPYHIALRGLFALVHELLATIPVGSPMPSPELLAERVKAHEQLQLAMPISAEDLAAPEQKNPAEGDEAPEQF